MRITKVETIAYHNVTQVHAGGIGWLWVRIHTDSGIYGTGESFPGPDSEKAHYPARLCSGFTRP